MFFSKLVITSLPNFGHAGIVIVVHKEFIKNGALILNKFAIIMYKMRALLDTVIWVTYKTQGRGKY